MTPPPLIPISLLGAQNAKAKHPANVSPPKLQRIPKPDGTDAQTRSPSRIVPSVTSNSSSNVEKQESTWFRQTEDEFLQSHDGTMPKPAQNIAVMGGKRYIVVPKNNVMAVQPAITIKPDKINDKPPSLQDGSFIDISNTADNSVAKLHTPPLKHLNTEDLSEKVNVTSDLSEKVNVTSDLSEKVNVTPDTSEKANVTPDLPEKVNITPDKEILKDIVPTQTGPPSPITIDEITEPLESLENKDTLNEIEKTIESVLENESSTVNIDNAPESNKMHASTCKSPENAPITQTSVSNNFYEMNTEAIKTDCQSLSSKLSTVTIKNK